MSARLTENEKCEIVRLKDTHTSATLATLFQTNDSTVRAIWRHARIKAGEKIFDPPRVSTLTGMRVRDWQPPTQAALDLLADEPLVTTGKTLDDLAPADCRWVIGKDEEGDARYCAKPRCGAVKGPTLMLCPNHGRRAVAKGSHCFQLDEWIEWTMWCAGLIGDKEMIDALERVDINDFLNPPLFEEAA